MNGETYSASIVSPATKSFETRAASFMIARTLSSLFVLSSKSARIKSAL